MNIYVWQDVAPITQSYHDDGSVLIVARDRAHAHDLWVERADQVFGDDYREDLLDKARQALDAEPDFTWHTDINEEPEVLVFPDAGCC